MHRLAFASVQRTVRRGLRGMTTQAFIAHAEKIQHQLSSSEPSQQIDIMRVGREFFDSEVVDDIATACSPDLIARICHAAAQLRISASQSTVFMSVLNEAVKTRCVMSMDMPCLARVLHSCLVLHAPFLYEILVSYVSRIMAEADTMDAITLAVIINSYGRAGVGHDLLYSKLCNAAAIRMRDPRISTAHVANVLHALSRVRVYHEPLILVLREHALLVCNNVSPIIAVTILDAIAELGVVDEQLFRAYEERVLSVSDQLQAPLLAVLLSCLATSGRATSELMGSLGERAIALAERFDSVSIAKTCDAYFRAGILAEDVFGALAERACKIAADFRADEIHLTLNALSSFDLLDEELFGLLASRVCALCRRGGYATPDDIAGILASFATVQEHNDELVHYCTAFFQNHMGPAMLGPACINAAWACAVLNVNNEAQSNLIGMIQKQPALLDLPPAVTPAARPAHPSLPGVNDCSSVDEPAATTDVVHKSINTIGVDGKPMSAKRRAQLEQRRLFVLKHYHLSAQSKPKA